MEKRNAIENIPLKPITAAFNIINGVSNNTTRVSPYKLKLKYITKMAAALTCELGINHELFTKEIIVSRDDAMFGIKGKTIKIVLMDLVGGLSKK